MKKVAIVGLGWIGMPLAFMLANQGYSVVGSKTSSDGVEAVRMCGVSCYQLRLLPELICDEEELTQLLSVDVLIITLPVKRLLGCGEVYRQSVQMLVDSAQAYGVKRVIFLSSSSVYGDMPGCFTEDSPLQPVSDSGKVLMELERWLHALPLIQVDILRLAGLVGPERHPGKFLSGKQGGQGGAQRVNLVHQDDVLSAIALLLQQPTGGRLYNLCAPQHPRKADFYPQMARQIGLPTPLFDVESDFSGDRIIDGSRICHELDFHYRYPDLTVMPTLGR